MKAPLFSVVLFILSMFPMCLFSRSVKTRLLTSSIDVLRLTFIIIMYSFTLFSFLCRSRPVVATVVQLLLTCN